MVTLKEINELLISEDFIKSYKNTYIKNNDLDIFLDNIDTNKKYYRTGINKNQRFKKVVNEDSQTIKDINSLINKLTQENYEKLKEIILEKLKAEYMVPYIIEKLVENSIFHHIYIPLYIKILQEIKFHKKKSILIKICDKHYYNLFNNKIDSSLSSYEQLCNENKKIDNIIGYSLLISHLEKENIIDNYIEKVLDPFINDLLEKNEVDTYKMLISFYSISEIHYTIIPERYKKILKTLQKSTKTSKIKFKIMDILGD